MIAFLLGLACGAIIVAVGVWVAAIYEERMGREVGRVFKELKPDLTVKWKGVDSIYRQTGQRSAAGVKVCSCIGALRAPHFVDPDCPFHGGSA